MKKMFQKFDLKRKMAAIMAVIITAMAFLPYIPESMVSFADYAQIIEPAAWKTWDASFYKEDAAAFTYKGGKGLTPTGLMYETKDFYLGSPVDGLTFPAGAKQYLVENKQYSDGSYKDFDKTFLYCVAGHQNGAQIYLGSQAFLEKYWTIDDMPEEFPTGKGASELVPGTNNGKKITRREFNFLMNIYATYLGSNYSVEACNDPNSGTAKYIVAASINWLAADKSAFTGDWETDLQIFRKGDDYLTALKQMNPNAVGDRTVYNQLTNSQVVPEYAARGCKNWAEWTFGCIWDAANIMKGFNVDSGQTVYYAKLDHSTDTYTVTVPYPNEEVKGYYQNLSAKDIFGDWLYIGPSDAGLVFSSQSGEVPTNGQGIATLYWANPNQIGAVLAKDLGSAQLATFKFYTQDPANEKKYTFQLTQTFFSAKLDKDLEIHVRIGSGGQAEVKRYKHTENFGTNYNVGLLKFDSETGKPLAGSHWDILEGFDASQLNSTDLDLDSLGDYDSNTGSLTGVSWDEDIGNDEDRISKNYSGGTGLNDSETNLYNQANSSGSQFLRWDYPENDPCNADDHITDENGELHYINSQGNIHSRIAHQDTKNYTYEKGYCSGHPAPVVEYEEVPEPEYDEETNEQTNESEIEAVEEYNQQLHDSAWAKWLTGVEECERLVEEGGFFHAIDLTGKTQREALEADRDRFYKDFISLTYEYSAKETTPAPGYSLHGSHPDDIPMEWRTVSSSEYKDYQSGGFGHTGGNSINGPDMKRESLKTDASIKPLNPEVFEKVMFASFGTSNRVNISQKEMTEVQPENETVAAEHQEKETVEEPAQDITEETEKEAEPEQEKSEETLQEAEEKTESKTVEETDESSEVDKETEPKSEKETVSETIEESMDEIVSVSEEETIEETQPESQVEDKAASEIVSKKKQTATDSEAEKMNGGVTLTGLLETVVSSLRSVANKTISFFRLGADDENSGSGSSLKGLPESTETSRLDPLDSSTKDWTFIAYDHRAEGEIHFNKKDMNLKAGESDSYGAYGDSQGDGTLEGAVYGLFAATDIPHPDGHSGVLFQKDNLVSIATTDRNGDASFLAITQAPGYTYNYQTGAIERTPGGWADQAPANLYTAMGKAIGKEADAERFVGHTERGSSITLMDSRNETAAGYEKLSSNQGKDGTGESSYSYPIENNEDLNGNCWIGRPLIVNADGTQYYIKELTRSEGYELSVYGKDAAISNREAFEAGGNPSAEGTVSAGRIGIDRVKKINTFTVKSSETTNGYQIYAQNIPNGASFYITRSEVVEDSNGTHTEYVTKEETALAQEEGARVIINGSPVMAKVGDTITLPNGETAVVGKVSDAEYDYTAVRPDNALRYTIPTFQDKKNTEDLMEDANAALKRASFKEPDEGAPWIMIPVTGDTFEEQAASLYEGMEAAGLSVFNCLRIQEITDGKAMIRYSYRVGSSVSASIYDEVEKILYIRNSIDYEIKGTNASGYLYTAYTPDQFEDFKENGNGFVTYAKVKAGELSKNNAVYPEDLSALTVLDSPERTYWVYSQGEPLRNNDGSIKKVLVEEEVHVAPGYELKDVDTPVAATYDGVGYLIEVAGSEGTESIDYKIKYQDDFVEGTYITPEEYAGYYGNISVSPNMSGAGTYIETVTLRYDRNQIYTDGGTRNTKVSVVERPIMQKIKITKDISVKEDGTYDDNTYAGIGHEDRYTGHGGGIKENARYLKNFRFKVYLKSNLERLYRAEDGTVTWQDRNGNIVDILAYRNSFPEKVQKLFTKVDYRTDSLTSDSNRAAIANTKLYSYTNDYINTDQNPGYTAILEKTIQKVKDESGNDREVNRYNYEKFFEAIKVANDDKWDRTENGSSSFKPFAFIKQLLFGTGGAEKQYPAIHNNLDMRNSINTSNTAAENALRSDNVRQFAITWYLDTEVAKLVSNNQAGEKQSGSGNEKYQDEIYDKALSEAIKKAENYLKPFFSYDFDQIYSIAWDSETDGGKDQDRTTLSADQEAPEAGYTYGVSEYLPYGTYIAVEQQPFSKDLGDLYNKHYKTDAPKEIELPAVYEGGKDGADKTPEALSIYYQYKASDTVQALSAKYQIRFNEEWPGENGEDLRKYVIRAHSLLGDYEIYPYGLDLDKLSGAAAGDPTGHRHFAITQGENDPVKDYYNTLVDPVEAGGNPSSHYFADDVNTGKRTANGSTYETNGVEKVYRYGSISEDKQIYDNVSFPSGAGEVYRDHVTAMEGMQTAYDGKFASMLVPWAVTEPADETTDTIQNGDGTASYKGYAYRKYQNTFYTSRLRIEKLDSETGENLLHDGALFTLYAASREDGENTDGLVKFFDTDTRIEGSKEFLEAMGARDIALEGNAWKGTVPAGTPICKESEQVILTDQEGRRTGQFEAFTTIRDGLQAQEDDPAGVSYQDQNVGYLTTPQPLGAGTYVLCEVKPPAGYVRTKPVAIEIYSDRTTYYLDENRDNRVAAAIYEDKTGEGTPGITNTARIYVGNTPVRLEVSKIKDSTQTVTYKTNTRLEGTELELKQKYGTENLEFGYKNGTYSGYAWYKGTLEYLESRKAAGEDVEPVYVDGMFAGYGLISRPLDTADDNNRYVAGAQMALYDAIEVKENGDSGDYGYDGVEVVRDRNNNVQSIQVLKGHAGTTIEFIREEDEEGSLNGEPGEGTWTYGTVERGDTDILFYSLGDLKVTETGANGKLYGYDRNGNRVKIKNQESIYVLKAGQPVFELTGGDLTTVKYSAADKCFTLSPGTILYHLDSNGNRDAYANPTTGMAYARNSGADPAKEGQKLLVWPVKVSKTKTGAVIAREKIKTWRIASINADTDQEYVTGTYNGNDFNKSLNPVLNGHGLPEYYQRSDKTYKKGDPVYDIDGDYVRYRYDDLLPSYNNATYKINNKTGIEDIGKEEDTTDDKKLYHRQGEAWIMENTWITGEKYPNNPFKVEMTVGQADMLKRVIPGTYILEEVKVPDGYTKGFPEGVTVTETREVQKAGLEDEKIKVEIVKTDAPDQYRIDVLSDYDQGSGSQQDITITEPKGAYSYGQVTGAHLELYKAKRVYTTDSVTYPKGYYFVKVENKPAEWTVENTADNTPVRIVADWITDGTPKYFEGIPAGDYILEEVEAAGGYARSSMELTVKATGEVQTINLKNDHTKLEVYKYYVGSTGKKMQLPNSHAATLALFEAKSDGNGTIIIADGKPVFDKEKKITEWLTEDLTEYTEKFEKSTGFMDRIKALLDLSENQSSFITDFEAAYREKGEGLTSLTWYTKEGERTAERSESLQTGKAEGAIQTWITDAGKTIRITIYRNVKSGSLDHDGKLPLNFEYQFNYKEENGVKSYDTLEGMHRIDYLPFNAEKDGKKVGNYVLVEEKTPEGFETADPKAIVLEETGSVQRFSLENEEKYINVLKVVTDGTNEYAAKGAELALYRADEAGNFVEDEAHHIETWLSGSDGRYTENDRFNGDIPEGFSVGDLKPHRIDKTPYGTYYVAELIPPAYMQKAAPVKITVGAEKIPVYRVINTPTVGKLEIQKKASDTGEGLENARFKVTNKDTGTVWYMTTGTDGKAEITGLPVGMVQTDGTIKPFTYAIEEISPPDFYQIFEGMKKFQFDEKGIGKEILYTCEIENQPTKIQFKKTNFENGMAVEGAEIAVYEAVVIDGEYQKVGDTIETFVSGPDGYTLTKKLSANRVYIMEELEAPTGYTISKPVIFAINKAGTGIKNVSNDFSVLKLACDNGSIEVLTVTGRVPVKVYTVLKDLDAETELPPFIGTGSGQIITVEDGIINGHLYEITEYTRYSDGRTEKSFKETKRIYFDKNGSYTIPSRTYLKTRQELADAEGNVLAGWAVNEDNYDYTIKNPITREIPIAQVTSSIGSDHSAVKNGNVIKYTVTYTNPYNQPADIRIKAVVNDGLDYLRSTDYGAEQNGIVTWNLSDIAAHESGTVDLVAVVSGETGTQANVYFETWADAVTKRTTLTNPIVPDGSIAIINKLTGTGKDQADEFTFHVRLMDSAGKTLTGYQAYSGSAEGRIKGEGTITITGDGYLTFAGLPYGTRYEIAQEPKDGYDRILSPTGQTEGGTITGEISKTIQSAVFKNNRNNKTIREILTAGGNYQLTETTTYSDGSSLTSGIYRFQLNASGMVDNVDMEDRPVHLYFSKVDIEAGEELDGGQYSLADEETGKVIYEFTKEKGEKTVIPAELLTQGKKYTIKEELSPEGYAYEKEILFTAEESGIPATIVMQDKKTEVEIKKIDVETGELLTGGRFSIREKETGIIITSFTTEGKPVLIKGFLTAGTTYELIEEEPPAGYAYSEKVTFTVPKEPTSITVIMEDKKTEILIKKVNGSLLTENPSNAVSQLPGSTLQILNEDKTPTKALRAGNGLNPGDDLIFTTGQQFEELKGQLEAGKNYWLHEVSPADGYAYAEDIPFTVSLNGDRDTVIMIDNPTHVILSKKAITGNEELPGNHMSIKDKEGNILEEWVSGEQPHELIAKLKAGERYWLHEILPADGYAYAKEVPFTVSQNGTIDMIEMKNEVTAVRLKKVDPYGQFLKGAILQVLDQQKNVVIPDFETTDRAIDITGRLTAGKTYYLHEVKAPSGYYLSADVAFTMPEAAELLEVTMTDSKKQSPGSDKMYLYKVEAATGQGIKGVEFSIYRPDGSLYLTVDTAENGYAKFDIPANGTYTYKETKAAPGYLATDHIYSFTIKNGEISENSTISVVNHPSPEVLIQKADAVTGKRLAGADLEIRNEAGMPVFTGITDESGRLSFQPLHVGKYTVHEIKAPEGYRKTDTYLTIHVTDAGAATGEFVMYNSPEQVRKKGFITATYQSSLNSFGSINHRGKGYWGWLSRLPKTGDIGLRGGLLLVIGMSVIVSGIIYVRRKRDKKNEK
ncbi:SpaA isopeptide-forming pilin-related protein [Lacrimispora sp. BS-2]|uniref:SpaA isopeptide-forming pilin-related protein n=1 Tax=Lacrimispora sp. BS-2 TaxID=3151850 RepID=A0AAU7PLE4_9FIRM